MGCRVFKALFGGFTVVLLVGLLLASDEKILKSEAPSSSSTSTHKEMFTRGDRTTHADSDPNYTSKRRVPNGPDPIHNRRAGKSGQPPGRA